MFAHWRRGIGILVGAMVVVASAVPGLAAAAATPAGPTCAHLRVALQVAPDLTYFSDVVNEIAECGLPGGQPAAAQPVCAHLVAALGVAPRLRGFPGVHDELAACIENGALAATTDLFGDLAGYGWAEADIALLAQIGVLQGEGHGIFDPAGHLTRAEFAALIDRIFALAQPSTPVSFVDVPATYWAYGDIEAAAPYMSQFTLPGGAAFEPAMPATRGEVAATIGKIEVAEGQAALPTAAAAQSVWAAFSDGAQMPAGLAQYAAVAVRMGFMKGYPGGSFGVNATLTRAEAAVLLARVLDASEGIGGTTAQTASAWIVALQPAALSIYNGSAVVTYSLDASAQVTLNGAASALATVPLGDAVTVTLDGQGGASAVAATAPSAPTVTGTWQGMSGSSASVVADGQTQAVALGTAPVAIEGGQIVSAASIAPGTSVTIERVLSGSALILVQ